MILWFFTDAGTPTSPSYIYEGFIISFTQPFAGERSFIRSFI